jgi:hypothetical protein
VEGRREAVIVVPGCLMVASLEAMAGQLSRVAVEAFSKKIER